MLLQHLLILLTAIWIFRRIFQWLRFPSLFGEIFAGFVVGPMMFGWVTETEAIRVLAELGVFFLMFHAGLEFAPDNIFKSFKGAIWVALGGIFFSFFSVVVFSMWFGLDVFVSVFIALVLSISAVEITARMLKDSGISRTRFAQTALTASIVSEVIILILFALFLDIFQTRAFDMGHLLLLCLKVFGYFSVVLWIGEKGSHYLHQFLYKGNKGFTLSLIIALLFGVFAEFIGLHFIIGAFLAGLFLQKDLLDIEMYDKLEDRVFGLSYSFLGPIFFATLAFHLDVGFLNSLFFFSGGLFLICLFMKGIGSGLIARRQFGFLESLGLGLAMNNRGALVLILAAVGLEEGVISQDIFSVLVLVSLATTFFSLIAFKALVSQISR